MDLKATNVKVLVACEIRFDMGGESVVTQLYARDVKSAINLAVSNKRESLKAAEKHKAEAEAEVAKPNGTIPEFTLDEVLEKATEMAELIGPDNVATE